MRDGMGRKGAALATLLAAALLGGCAGAPAVDRQTAAADSDTSIAVTSPAFTAGGAIPRRHTCEGENLSPALAWSGVPRGARSLAVVCEDPDAPSGTWIHWVLYDLPASARGLPEGVPPRAVLDDGARQGENSFRRVGYGGPCPPPGPAHRYFFRVYALDRMAQPRGAVTRAALAQAMRGHVLAAGRLMGSYGRGGGAAGPDSAGR